MLTFIPFSAIKGRHLAALAASLNACPEAVRPSARNLVQDLAADRSRLYELTADAIVVLSKQDNRLVIDAASMSIFDRLELIEGMAAICAEQQCDTIETTVFDSRLADAIKKVGGQVESITLVLPVRVD
jgi:hypothetical protein